jgi:hypothetical protein
VSATLENVLRVLLQDVPDLTTPLDDGILKNERLILGGSLLGRSDIALGQWQDGLAINKSDSDDGIGTEAVELVHEVLAHQVTPSLLVERVAEDRHEYSLTERTKIV